MTPEQLARLATDARMTPDAVRVVLYLDSLGPADEERTIKGEDLSILLQGGEKPIRAAIARAEHCGYLTHRLGGRAGHKLTLTGAGNDAPQGGNPETEPRPQGRHLENDAPQGGNSVGNDSPRGGNSPHTRAVVPTTDPSPPSSPPPSHARPANAEVDRLRQHLGEHAAAAEMMVTSAAHPPSWIAAVLGKYGPSGTQRRIYTGIPPDRQPAVLATALMEYATSGEIFRNQLFDGFLRKAAEHERNPERSNGGAPRGPDPGRAAAPPRRGPPPTAAIGGDRSRRSGFIIE